ncbi:MAG: 30S ribosomal protein S15 [DPANN group archaeon]|nr:30S ribosomal protein S15 [DPANN group archaeon]
MARMHSRKGGKSGSTKPADQTVPKWVDYKKGEVEKLIVKLGKQDMNSAVIGTILRDRYGIPAVDKIVGKKISKILIDNEITHKYPEDMLNLMRRAVVLGRHMDSNKKDVHSKRGLELIQSKIRRLGKYYIKNKRLPADWKYNPQTAKIEVQ